MLPQILIALISLLALVALHELGHFFVAKKFNVKVEEFGIGLPPRLFGRKFGETIYSLNLLPLGAFVRLSGEEEEAVGPRSFSEKPIWQRAAIVLGGVVSFWIIAAIIFSFLMASGLPSVINDEDVTAKNPHVQIIGVVSGSPAEKAGLRAGDIIIKIQNPKSKIQNGSIDKVRQVQELAEQYKGQEIFLTIQRGRKVFDVSLVPRTEPPKGEGPMGIALVRVGLVSYPWWQAPFRGIEATIEQSWSVVRDWGIIFANFFHKGSLPPGTKFSGPVGIFFLFTQASQMGVPYFFQLVAKIAIYLALFNALPIPAVDGGKLFFICLEAIRRKPIPRELEQKITAAFFLALIILLIFVTIKDISRII